MGHHHRHSSTENIKVAFLLNLGFTLVEIVGGILTNSVAILSDAVHDLGDTFSLGLAWYLDGYSKQKGNEKYSYGYGRFSLLAAGINVIVLIIGSLLVLSEAIPRLLNPEPTNATGMILFAIGGVLVNGLAVFRMKDDQSMNAKVVAWHLLEDVLGWVAVLIVGIILLFVDLYILDPILSILVTLYILYNVIGNLRRTVALFLQATPENVSIPIIENQWLALNEVQSVHHTHVWSLDGEHHVLTTHLVVDECATKEEVIAVKQQSKGLAHELLHLDHVTIEIEYGEQDCSMQKDEIEA